MGPLKAQTIYSTNNFMDSFPDPKGPYPYNQFGYAIAIARGRDNGFSFNLIGAGNPNGSFAVVDREELAAIHAALGEVLKDG